ncbi:MAG TPA: hypothetical protein VKF15_04835 [Nitrososphaerales archaeon]|nr:hypothetical protein [Nitrososphaerales archaeon]
MSADIAAEPFRSASQKVEEAHQQAVGELRAKVARAKSDALAKVKA